MNEQRYYAMAVNADGQEVELARIPEPSVTLARQEYAREEQKRGDYSVDPRWYAGGFHRPETALAIETREKRGGKWETVKAKTGITQK